MGELAFTVDYWHWFILGVVLLIIEIMAPSFFFLWMAVAAGVTGMVLFLAPELGWQYQLILFSVLSVLSIVGFRRFQRASPPETDQPNLNRRGEQYIGRTFTLDRPIVNEMGELRVDDSTWRITGKDMAAGSRIRVVDADGVILKVEESKAE